MDLALEAAHIKWRQAGGPNVVPNGLALCAVHHKGLDRGAIGIDDGLRILLSRDLHGGSALGDLFLRFHGRRLFTPHSKKLYPDTKFLAWHRTQVFRLPVLE